MNLERIYDILRKRQKDIEEDWGIYHISEIGKMDKETFFKWCKYGHLTTKIAMRIIKKERKEIGDDLKIFNYTICEWIGKNL